MISIHALTKSATEIHSVDGQTYGISIHALTKSATLPLMFLKTAISYFNPRTHKECDHNI